MATVTEKLITAEEFFQMPDPQDGSKQELLKGKIEIIPPPGGFHGACCSRVGRRLGNFVDANQRGTVCSNGTGFICERDPDTVRGPDISYWSKERLPQIPRGYNEVPPHLAVEVVSPHDHYSRVQQTVRHHLGHGVKLVWVVDPEDRSVTVYRSLQQGTIRGENETLTGEDVLPGFSCRVAELLP